MVRGRARGGKGSLRWTNAWPWGHVPPKLPHLDPLPQPTILDSPPSPRAKAPRDPPPPTTPPRTPTPPLPPKVPLANC